MPFCCKILSRIYDGESFAAGRTLFAYAACSGTDSVWVRMIARIAL